MKVTLEKIWNSQQALPKLLGRDLPVKVAYWLSRNARKIESELKTLNDQRIVLVKKYGKEDDKKQWNVLAENRKAFEKDYQALMETEIELDIKEINLSDLQEIKLSAQECLAIDFMLKE